MRKALLIYLFLVGACFAQEEIVLQAVVAEFNEDYDISSGIRFEQQSGSVGSFESIVLPNLLEQTSGAQFGGVYKNGQFVLNAIIDAAENKSLGKIITSPKVVVQSSSEAILNSKQEEPIGNSSTTVGTVTTLNPQFKDIGVMLKARPIIISGTLTQLSIDISISNLIRFRNMQKINVPVRSERNLVTKVTIENGYAWVVGGLYADKQIDTNRGIPFLSDIPYIGKVFSGTNKQNNRTQLIVAVSCDRIIKKQNIEFLIEDYNGFRRINNVEDALID